MLIIWTPGLAFIVDTVPELAQREPKNLHTKLIELNEAKKLLRRLPSIKHVADWVEYTKSLGRAITY